VATTRIEVDKALWARVQEHAASAGYSSPEELLQHLLEKELAKTAEPASERSIKGIGYIDAGRDI
jgi:hypothetical protein